MDSPEQQAEYQPKKPPNQNQETAESLLPFGCERNCRCRGREFASWYRLESGFQRLPRTTGPPVRATVSGMAPCPPFELVALSGLFAKLYNRLGFDGFIASAALRIKECEQFLQGLGIGSVPEVSSFSPDCYQILVLELFQVMRECGSWNVQLRLDITNHHPVRMSG